MDRQKIKELIDNIKDDVEFAMELSDNVVLEITKDLDILMAKIKRDVIDQDYPSIDIVKQYLEELTNALYFIDTKCIRFGFYEDISKSNAKLKYNKSYTENQIKSKNENIKTTVTDLQLYAEDNSLDETMLSLIYSRSSKIVNAKIDNASEMIRTLSKVLTVHMNEITTTKFTNRME